MKERGMIFNGEMVRAIIDGRKTQTRRIVKGTDGAVKFCKEWDINGEEIFVVLGEKDHTGMNPVLGAISCPFGAVGDRIWVRETFQGPLVHEELFEEYSAYPEKFETPEYCEYAADGGVRPEYCDLDDNLRHGWRPSIHMPRWASRILLEITNVRVERLNSMHDVDAMREGIQNLTTCLHSDFGIPGVVNAQHPVRAFQLLWESIYGTDSWHANPWVWVIEFKRVEGGAA
ncbi:morphogenetic protein [Klebsiella pneumoniae]|uniref:morphogenetic protein n=1 Tax=Klebsiella pneumoniae TaxID=573 RepID=UPI0038D093D4|nr:morphogenetic protein [Klebsiella pneumoniae]HBZ7844792.1 morphogenetic protein [Klebsiella pneumoniae]HCJ9431445.1 morphogenetic protein [Klebsiella pneumoniae]